MYENFSDEDHQDAYSTLVKGLQILLEENQGVFVTNSEGQEKVIIKDNKGSLNIHIYNPDDFPPFREGTIINFT